MYLISGVFVNILEYVIEKYYNVILKDIFTAKNTPPNNQSKASLRL